MTAPKAARRRHTAGFWLVAFAYLATMAFSTAPTPLYPLYQQQLGFSTLTITVVFAVYAIGVLTSLFFAGHLSDRVGRRPAMLAALLIQLGAAALFLLEPALPVLLAARFLSGLGVGMLTATATASLQELHRASRPGASSQRFEIVSTAANIGGLGVGPLLSGALAEQVGWALFTPYLVLGLTLVAAAAAVGLVPETVAGGVRRPYRPQGVRVPSGDRSGYATALAGGFVAFAVFGVFSSLAPGFLATALDVPSPAVAGLITFAVYGGAAVAQTLTAGLRPARRRGAGVAAQLLGLAGLTAGMHAASLPLFVLGGVLSGIGSGLLFKAAVGAVAESAEPAKRGEALAGLFLVAYLGLALPVVGVGLATVVTTGTVAMTWLAVALVVVLLAMTAVERRTGSATPVRTPRTPEERRRHTALALAGLHPNAVLFASSTSAARRALSADRSGGAE
jgi:MFS family permease